MQSFRQMKAHGFHYNIVSLHLIYFNFTGFQSPVDIELQDTSSFIDNSHNRLVAP